MGDLSTHFSRSEFRCKCGDCSCDTVDAELIRVLEFVRRHFDRPISITSGVRCEDHNRRVGGSKNSQHVLGRAADIIIDGVSPKAVQAYINNKFTDWYGLGCYPTFTHIDTRRVKARWMNK